LREQRVELVEPGFLIVVAKPPGGALDPPYDRIERAVAALRGAVIAHPDVRLVRDGPEELRHQPRLADASFA